MKIPVGTRTVRIKNSNVIFYNADDLVKAFVNPRNSKMNWKKLRQQLNKSGIYPGVYSHHIMHHQFKSEVKASDAITSRLFFAVLQLTGWQGDYPDIDPNDPGFGNQKAWEEINNELAKAQAEADKRHKEQQEDWRRAPGWIYLIGSPEIPDVYKIGMSRNPKSRLKQLQLSNPHKLRIVYSFETFYVKDIEAILHERYKDYRLEGEWFRLDADHLAEFKSITIESGKVVIKRPGDAPATRDEGQAQP